MLCVTSGPDRKPLPSHQSYLEAQKINMSRLNPQTYQLPENLASSVRASLQDWSAGDKVRRLWAADSSLWTGADEGNWLGWLTIVDDQLASSQNLMRFAEDTLARRRRRSRETRVDPGP